MKLTNYIVNKIGYDKLLHMFLFGWTVSLSATFGVIPMLCTFGTMTVLSVIKEYMDSKFDWKDLLYGLFGGVISIFIHLI